MTMRHQLGILAAALLPGSALAQVAVDDPLEFLRNAAIETRLALAVGRPFEEVTLFNTVFADGRPTIEVITDQIASAAGGAGAAPGTARDPMLIDAAVGVCLAEAERMKSAGAAGSAASYRAARKGYLEAAARLLESYNTVAAGTFDAALGGLADPATWVDWSLPGEIQIREAAGSARINVATGEFGGRLSGEVVLPKFDANFVVPNASFDSRGNIDLSAYGTASFPPDSAEKVTVSVPPRRPLILHLSEDGDFRIAGSARVRLPDGNQFEAHFDADQPRYEFGLAYSGNLTLKMAKEVTLLRPTIDPATVFDPGAINGLALFFGSLSKGYESFLEASPDLPSPDDLNVGVAPEFTTPETVLPFDVFDAWAVGLVNDHVRPLVNGSFEASMASVREQIRTMRASVRSAQDVLVPTLEDVRRLRRYLDELERARATMADANAAAVLGDEATGALADVAVAAADVAMIAADYLEATPPEADFKTGFAAIRLWLGAETTSLSVGNVQTIDTGLALSKIDQWTDNAFARSGFDRSGAITDAAKAAALGSVDIRVLGMAALDIDANRLALGDSGAFVAPAFFALELQRTKMRYAAAVASSDIEARAEYAARLLDLAAINENSFAFTSDEGDRALMVDAYLDTAGQIAADRGIAPLEDPLAWKLMAAADRLVDGHAEPTNC